jgi:hypothetical protein
MQFDAATIERMVRDVLKQIQPSSAAGSTSQGTSTLLAVPQTKTAVAAAPETQVVPVRVILGDRIITADLLKEKIRPASQLVIGAKSIITPAAHDFLKLNRITWERGTTNPAASSASAAAPVVGWRIVVSSVNESVRKAVAAIAQQRPQVKQDLVGTAQEAATSVLSAMSRAEVPGIVVVTSNAHAVACRVNRNSLVRAAVVSDLKSWSAVETSMYPNVVCIDPAERSFMELQNVLNRIVSKPVAEPPADWIGI